MKKSRSTLRSSPPVASASSSGSIIGNTKNKSTVDRSLRHAILPIVFMSMHADAVGGPDFIAEGNHASLPPAVEAKLRNSDTSLHPGGALSECKLVGKKLNLSRNGRSDDYAVTTADACGWGNAKGPIWLMHAGINGYEVVLTHAGYGLFLGPKDGHALRSIHIYAATAGWQEESQWVYKNGKYVLTTPAR